MIIIHAMNSYHDHPRALSGRLEALLEAFPVVVVTGPRQVGKSTLVQSERLARGRTYLTLDDFDIAEQARSAPEQLVRRAAQLTLDEVQREPALLLAIKRAVDQDRPRRPGRFLVTGSANLLLMRQVSESLAGRAAYLTLRPMTRAEQRGAGRAAHWDLFYSERPARWLDAVRALKAEREDWRRVVRVGGYPTPALERGTAATRRAWFESYAATYLERDLRQLSAVGDLVDFRRLMHAVCLRLGNLINQTELGRDVGLSQATVHRHLNLLETSHQLVRLPAYAVNRTRRLIKTPKAYWVDVALALSLSGEAEPGGAHLENLLLLELLAWADLQETRSTIGYWRTAGGTEVDFVVEQGERLLPIEVKATTRPCTADAAGLLSFREEYGRRVAGGLLLHAGDETFWLAEGVLAVPWWKLM